MNTPRHLSTAKISLLLVLLNLLVYGQVIGFEFVSFDDAFYVENPQVKNGLTWEGLAWAFSLRHNYSQFLNWVSHMVDVELFGMNPAGHHAVSLLWHIANTLLLFHFLNRLTGERNASALAAALFAVHPLHVETVAWVADRKDLMAVFFGLLSLEAYRRYVCKPSFLYYGSALAAFLLALLSKPVMVVLPCVFLLIDVWPLKRLDREPDSTGIHAPTLGRRLVEKIPFFAIIPVFLFMTAKGFEMRHLDRKTDLVPLAQRLADVPVLYMKYLFHTVWPSGLTVFYPAPQGMPPVWQWAGSLAVLLGITAVAWVNRRRWPWLMVGWLWFAGSLLPLMGISRIGDHLMADRYTYFPLIGLFIAAAWGLSRLPAMTRTSGRLSASVGILLVLILMPVSFLQTRTWSNSFTLYAHTLTVDPTNHVAHNNVGLAWAQRNQIEKAAVHYRESTRHCPRCIEAWLNLGETSKVMQQWDESIRAFEEARKIFEDKILLRDTPGKRYRIHEDVALPIHLLIHERLGELYHIQGDGRRAIDHTRQAEALYSEHYGPNHPKAAALRHALETYVRQYGNAPKDEASQS